VLAGAPVIERRLDLAGVSTAVLEGGQGPPVVLLHGQGGWAGMGRPVIPELLTSHRVIAADLPGLGASETPDCPPDAARVLAWLGELIQRTCPSPPALVGASLGGSIAARFAIAHPDLLSRPARMRALMGQRWEVSQAYGLDLARTPSMRAANRRMLRELGTRTIPTGQLARITVPTTLIWGRQDRVMRLRIAEEARARYGWPLHVIEDAGHFLIEQPEAFRGAMRAALGGP
jgi:pimeloyl-ACP methyl ester carboxylesterase